MSDESSTPEAAPVRVPNVSAGARSGLDHVVIGSNAQAAHEANLDLQQQDPGEPTDTPEVEVPAELQTVDALTEWVHAADTPEGVQARADAVLAQEQEREKPRTTLVEALETVLHPED